jgi:hypothetical protein
MKTLESFAIQVGILVVPIVLFVLVKPKVGAKASRVTLAVCLGVIMGAVAHFLASHYGWRPIASGGKLVPFGPAALGVTVGAVLVATLSLVAVAKPLKKEKPKA